jgi:hypothetical protein
MPAHPDVLSAPRPRRAVAGLLRALTVLSAFVLVACGGTDAVLEEDQGTVRFYATSFSRSDSLALIQFEGGLIYGFYQSDISRPTYPEFAYAGFFVSGPDHAGYDFDFDAKARIPISLLGFSATEKALDATLHAASGDESLVAPRAPGDTLATDTSLLPGTYAVQVRSVRGGLKGAASVDTNGTLSAALADGCVIAVKLASRPLANLYDAAATIGIGCPLGSGAFSGHALQNAATRNVYVLLVSPAGEGLMLLAVPS